MVMLPGRCMDARVGFIAHWCRVVLAGMVAAAILPGAAWAGDVPGKDLQWIGSWAAAPSDELASVPTVAPAPFANITLRTVITLSAGGDALRLHLSNELGAAPLRVGKVTLARWRGGAVVPGSMQVVRFSEADSVLIASGAARDSDPIAMTTQPDEQLVVSLYIPGPIPRLTGHVVGLDPSWSIEGEYTAREVIPAALPGFTRLVLSRVDVGVQRGNAMTVVALGDSITDGYQSSFAAGKRWPDVFARLARRQGGCTVGVANQGISGNRVLTDNYGLSAIGRLSRDVFSVPGARMLVVLEGVNDLGYPQLSGETPPSAEDLEAAFRQIADEAHARGMRIVVGTILPYKGVGAPYFTAAGEQTRQAVNAWLLASPLFDAVVDVDRLVADRSDPERLAAEFDSGDGIHPSDKGYEAIGQAFFAGARRAGLGSLSCAAQVE